MIRRPIIFLLALAATFLLFSASSYAKHSDLDGQWYSPSSSQLRAELETYLDQADVPELPGRIIGVIAPHAGYRFSGPVAAYSYKALKEASPDKIILIAFSHKIYLPGKVSILNDDYYSTPLGKVKIDKDLTYKILSASENISYIPEVFAEENSVELQIPFIQTALKDVEIVVLALCDQRSKNCINLADTLYKVLSGEKDFAVIASTDMSHYLTYDSAVDKDTRTIDVLNKFIPDEFYKACMKEQRYDGLMCGYGAVYTLMELSKKLGANELDILKYANSGDTSGLKRRVVGYLSAAFIDTSESERGTAEAPGVKEIKKEGDNMFTTEEKQELLGMARDTIGLYLETGKKFDVGDRKGIMEDEMGAFVTLHKNGQLRGCIGHMTATGPLCSTVRDMAIAAAVEDPRFPPVRLSELDDIDIEISVLSPMRKIESPDEIELGKHGVMVRSGYRSGVYLPQVADETGWTKEEFMDSLCAHKAGIPADSWKTGKCDIYVFTAEVFGEKELENN